MAKPAFQRIEALFHETLAQPPDARSAFLDKACAGDADLRAAVEELLRHAGPDDPTLAGPVASEAARIRAQKPTVPLRPGATTGAAWPEVPGYDVLEELGHGGMGVVYKVRQRSLSRIVALKMLLPTHPDADEMLARFRNEVEALARLQHPHIITIYDIGDNAGRPYFTMEFIDGPSLAHLLDGKQQDPLGSARLIETLAHTMHAVHQHGIIHRDLKPANVLLKRNEDAPFDARAELLAGFIPKITDFGLAKDQAAASALTATGVTMGTPSYMAPEQAGTLAGAGSAADIYALGSILYEMLTGRPPFEGNPVEVVQQLLNDEPISPSVMRPRLPADLVTICLKCLEKSPPKRYANAMELAEDLHRFQAGESIHAQPVSKLGRLVRWCRRRPLVAGLGALCALLAVLLFVTVLVYDFQLRAALANVEARSEEQRQQIVQLNVNIGITEIERGNRFMAILRFTEALRLDDGHPEREREHRVRIGEALRHCPRLLQLRVQDRQVLCTRLEANKGWIATVGSDHTVEVADVMTGRSAGAILKMDALPACAAIGLEGRRLAAVGKDGAARLWDLATGKSLELAWRDKPPIRRLAFHPDGGMVITLHADNSVRLWDMTAKRIEMPPLSAAPWRHAALSDDARWLFTTNAEHTGQAWDLTNAKAFALPIEMKQDALLAAISPGGRRVALVGADKMLRVWDVATGRVVGKSMAMPAGVDQLAFSPDAEQILTVDHDKTLTAWRLRVDECPCAVHEVGRHVERGCWDALGKRMAMIDAAGAAHVMDPGAGRMLTPPLAPGGPLQAVAVHDRTIVTVSKRGTVAIWELPAVAPAGIATPDLRPVADLLALAQLVAGGRIDERQQWHALEPAQLRAAWESCQGAR